MATIWAPCKFGHFHIVWCP